MAPKKKTEKAVVTNIVRKEYKFTKANVTLSFTLRNDIPQELSDFKELLGLAREEVSEDLEAVKRK